MSIPISCSLLISTYNWPEALELSLKSAIQQSILPTEIIVADDGSTTETKAIITTFQHITAIPIIHVWQPDNGFQLSKIRNKALSKVSSSYVIQIDGDIILHPDFIKDHLAIAEKGCFITGSRILLNDEYSKLVLKEKIINFEVFIKGSKNFFNGLRIPVLRNFFSSRYKIKGKNKFDVKGCNMSFWMNDLIAVNGYDESYVGWGREDSNLAIRLINSGIQKKYLKMGGIQYHIYHKEAVRDQLLINTKKMNATIFDNTKWCDEGLSQYL